MNNRLVPLVLAALVLVSGCADNRPVKVYRFIDSVKHADFDYRALKDIDRLPTPYPPGSPFQVGELPIASGDCTLYKFQAEYRGRSAEAGKERFHDILVVKLDGDGKVADAFHYTLEWADSPSLDLFRAGRRGFVLENGLALDRFAFTNPQSRFHERGVISLYSANEATRFLARLKELVRQDKKTELAGLVYYPLVVTAGRATIRLTGQADFSARYSELFTPRVKETILAQRPEEIYADYRGYMIGNGALWFDDWGEGIKIVTLKP